jgi:spore maturation protein CgeB
MNHNGTASSDSTSADVAIVSTAPDELNTNHGLRDHVAEGFAQALPRGASVRSAASEDACNLIEASRPALVVALGSIMPDNTGIRDLRRSCDRVGAHLALWLHDDPYELDFAHRAEDVADSIFTCESAAVPYYRHPSVFHLPLAASPTFHFRPIEAEYDYDISFCGYAYENRVAFVRDLLEIGHPARLAVLGDGWPSLDWQVVNKRLSPGQLADLYARSMLVLNIGRDHDLANARHQPAASTPGPRTFEAAMAGAAQAYFTTSLEVTDYFEPEAEIVLIDSARDLVSAFERFAGAPLELIEVRQAAQARALRDHTYAARARKLLRICGMQATAAL